uniref:(northern house mosquito) hypothetical protein n=1 Tax=Culex pipiens TaxID=7175 RepID=A0A8D8CMK4_CULPI
MCWGGAGCPCIILAAAAAAAVLFHLHAEQPLLLLAQFAIAKVVVQQLNNRITLPTQLVPSSITVSRDAEVSDKNTYQMATSFPRNWENLSRENYDTHARFTTFFSHPRRRQRLWVSARRKQSTFPAGSLLLGSQLHPVPVRESSANSKERFSRDFRPYLNG